MLPEMGGPHPAEDDRDRGIDPLGDAGDLDPSPPVGMQNRKPDHLRPLRPQHGFHALRREFAVVPVQHLDIVTVRLQHGRHVENPHRRGLDVFRVQPPIEKIRIDQ